MKNRLIAATEEAGKKKGKLFCAFLTLGFPDIRTTKKLIVEFEKAGVDVIELGFPFSDPMADGPTIQYSSEWALKKGVGIEDSFRLVRELRKEGCKVPIVFFTYLNPIFHYGLKRFAAQAKASGFDGVIVPDLPPEGEPGFVRECRKKDLAHILLVAPTTEKKRAAFLARESRGFIYYVSLRGVTGARKALPSDIQRNLKSLKRSTKKPVLIGFGVSSPEQGRQLSRFGEGVIVGSAIVEALRRGKGKPGPAVSFVRQMIRSVKGN